MALKAVVDNLDTVDAAAHEFYEEKDGKFHLVVEGLEQLPTFRRVKDEAAQNRIKLRDEQKKVSAYAALGTPEELQTSLDRIPELEAAATGNKNDPAAIEAIVNTRLAAKTAPLERTIATLQTQITEKDGVITGFQTEKRTRAVHDTVRTAAKKAGVTDAAVEDALLLAERVFEVAEDGSVVTRDGVGVTPGVDPSVWFTEIQPKRPHWYGPTQGGGATGSGGSASGVNPFTAAHWNMTKQGEILKADPRRAEQMARAAGTTVGGKKPAK